MSNSPDGSSLTALRQSLDVIDQALIENAAKRQAIVAQIGEIKAAEGRQLRDFRREREVIAGVRAQAEALDLDPDVAEDLMSRLITASLTQQERDQVKRIHRGAGQQVLVIGGAGRLGRWLVQFFDAQGYTVTVADPAPIEGNGLAVAQVSSWQEAGLDFDVMVLATPPGLTSQLLYELAEQQPRGLLFDVGSIKSPLREALVDVTNQGCLVCSIHPMFGPDTPLLSGRHVLVMDTGNSEAVLQAKALFADTMAETVEVSLDAHDRLMALILGLSHALNLIFMTALTESGIPAVELRALSSTTFERQLAIARDVADESPELYYEIQKLNQQGTIARKALEVAIGQLNEAVAADEPSQFVALMRRGQAYLSSLGRR